MAETPDNSSDQPPSAAARLMAALRGDDHAAFYKEIKTVDDINMDDGALLQAATRAQNKLFMRELITRGADVAYCMAGIYKEIQKIPRSRYYDEYHEEYVNRFQNREDEKHYKELNAAVDFLRQYQRYYNESVAPAEIAKNQHLLLEEIQSLKAEIAELRDGKPLEKTALPAPAHLRKTDAPAPGRKP